MTMTFTVLDASNSARVTVAHIERPSDEDVDLITLNDLAAVVQAIRTAQRAKGWNDLSKLWLTIHLPSGSGRKKIDTMHCNLSHFFRGQKRRHPFAGLTEIGRAHV